MPGFTRLVDWISFVGQGEPLDVALHLVVGHPRREARRHRGVHLALVVERDLRVGAPDDERERGTDAVARSAV